MLRGPVFVGIGSAQFCSKVWSIYFISFNPAAWWRLEGKDIAIQMDPGRSIPSTECHYTCLNPDGLKLRPFGFRCSHSRLHSTWRGPFKKVVTFIISRSITRPRGSRRCSQPRVFRIEPVNTQLTFDILELDPTSTSTPNPSPLNGTLPYLGLVILEPNLHSNAEPMCRTKKKTSPSNVTHAGNYVRSTINSVVKLFLSPFTCWDWIGLDGTVPDDYQSSPGSSSRCLRFTQKEPPAVFLVSSLDVNANQPTEGSQPWIKITYIQILWPPAGRHTAVRSCILGCEAPRTWLELYVRFGIHALSALVYPGSPVNIQLDPRLAFIHSFGSRRRLAIKDAGPCARAGGIECESPASGPAPPPSSPYLEASLIVQAELNSNHRLQVPRHRLKSSPRSLPYSIRRLKGTLYSKYVGTEVARAREAAAGLGVRRGDPTRIARGIRMVVRARIAAVYARQRGKERGRGGECTETARRDRGKRGGIEGKVKVGWGRGINDRRTYLYHLPHVDVVVLVRQGMHAECAQIDSATDAGVVRWGGRERRGGGKRGDPGGLTARAQDVDLTRGAGSDGMLRWMGWVVAGVGVGAEGEAGWNETRCWHGEGGGRCKEVHSRCIDAQESHRCQADAFQVQYGKIESRGRQSLNRAGKFELTSNRRSPINFVNDRKFLDDPMVALCSDSLFAGFWQ
ncbi:hypothetical protein B0H16DRAFT_1783168 [Mycena metata]|uniref:Uncharacterized protein n=1 Tax=Mycena metata TaxID=1033252 RepID=A0AAD7P1N1_9AGAR|nr:hypothetical protein B0H16DRAFT_1783168 [Mycena metata]